MKHMKKFMALFAALALVLAMAVPAFAAQIDVSKHDFDAYQIFSATIDSTGKLTSVQWGSGVNENTILDTLKNNSVIGSQFQSATTATDVAEIVGGWQDGSADALEFAKIIDANKTTTVYTTGTGSLTFSGAGYYLIVDKTTDTSSDARNLSLLSVATAGQTVTPQVKSEYPTVEKKVQENKKDTNTTGDYGTRYNDTADYNIGDAVPFKLIGTIPDMSHYTTYKYEFHDTLSNSLTPPNASEVKVYIADDKAGTNQTEVTSSFSVSVTGQQILVSTSDLKNVSGAAKGKYVIVEYSAVLNSNASIGNAAPGNTNEVYLKYSNNPNGSGEGQTPPDKVIVFTYELNANKIDGYTHEKLEGVTFSVYRMNASNEKEYARVSSNKLIGWTTDSSATDIVLTSDDNGNFSVIGLDDGTYYIHEITPLAGYNPISDIKVEIIANTSNGQNGAGETSELKSIKLKVDDQEQDSDTVTIENRTGTTLPSTGGIGTTIFYVVGGGLMVAAAVLLVAKKRMENK